MEFLVKDQVGLVSGDHSVTCKFYIDMVQTNFQKVRRMHKVDVHSLQEMPLSQLGQEKEEAHIVLGQPNCVTQVVADLLAELKEQLIACLIRNNGIFAWSP